MALPASDAFTDTNGTNLTDHDASWTLLVGQLTINTNALYPNKTGGGSPFYDNCHAFWNADSFDDDQYSQATIVAQTSGTYTGVDVRASATGSLQCYDIACDSADAKYVEKWVSGSFTELANDANVWGVNDVIRLEANGTSIRPMVNGSTDTDLGIQTDSSIASGSAGVEGYGQSTSARIDDWEGGDLAAGRTTYNTDPYGLGIALGVSRTFKVGGL